MRSPREQHLRYAVCLIWGADVNHPASQEDVVRNWKPAHSLVEDAIPGAKTAPAPCLPILAVTFLCLQQKRGLHAASLLSFDICSILCSVSGPGCELEPFMGKFIVCFFLFSFLSVNPTIWIAISCYLPQIVLRSFRPSPYPKDL